MGPHHPDNSRDAFERRLAEQLERIARKREVDERDSHDDDDAD